MIDFFKKTKAFDGESEVRLAAAKNLIETPMFDEVISHLENRYFEALYNSEQSDKDVREVSFHKLQAVREIKDYLQSIIKSANLNSSIRE